MTKWVKEHLLYSLKAQPLHAHPLKNLPISSHHILQSITMIDVDVEIARIPCHTQSKKKLKILRHLLMKQEGRRIFMVFRLAGHWRLKLRANLGTKLENWLYTKFLMMKVRRAKQNGKNIKLH